MPATTDRWRRCLTSLLAAILIASLFQTPAASAKAQTPSAKKKAAKQKAARKKAAERKRLLRAVGRNPSIVMRPSFMRKAGLFGIDLPVTIRLTRALDQAGAQDVLDDAFQLDLGTDVAPAGLPSGNAAGVVSSTLDGGFIGSLRFSQDPAGYGGLGIVELGFGDLQMTATGFDLIHDTATPCTLARTNGPVTLSEAPGSQGYIDLFGGVWEASLHTSFSFSSEVRNTCADPFTTTSVMNGVGRPPLPIRMQGSFRISPALTADGRFRLGRMQISGTQRDSFAKVHTCTLAPPPATCPAGDPSEAVLPSRLLATSFNAEMLIGASL